MSKVMINLIEELKGCIKNAINKAIEDGSLFQGEIPEFNIEIPSDRAHGDLASNVAMASARSFRMAPIKIAEIIIKNMGNCNDMIEKIESAGAGFINFFLNSRFYSEVLNEILKTGSEYGSCDYGKNKKLMVEFVSANPTGPMHMGNARLGAMGDCLAAVLKKAGYNVWREFYINDAGNQIEKFGLSLDIRYRQIWEGSNAPELPEDSYHGEDIKELAKEFSDLHKDSYISKTESERREALVNFALPRNINRMKKDMLRYRIEFDEWFHESKLHENGEVAEAIKELKDRGLTYDLDGALWYKAKEFGAEKDEVLLRKNGNPTYFAADIAYHRNKFITRGFDKCIDIWGADHHGHVARVKGAMDALGIDRKRLDILLIQFVKLVRNGEVVRMSKRTGKAVQLADLLDEVTPDAARFLFNMREAGSKMDFDLELAVRRDSENPVYYVQYAHARICSIFKGLPQETYEKVKSGNVDLNLLKETEERGLIYYLATFTNEIIQSAKDYDPVKITRYVIYLANLFHKFYNSCRVRCENQELMCARLVLCDCVRVVIKNILDMFNVSAPESM